VRNTPTADRLAVSYETVIEFANRKDPHTGEWMVKPQATVSADIEISKAENVLAVPNAAVQFTPAKFDIEIPKVEKGQRVLWVLMPDGRTEPRVVRIGISDGRWTQITEGDIKPGEEVIVEEHTEKKTQFRLPFGG
jgi:HlyD family secretion protein